MTINYYYILFVNKYIKDVLLQTQKNEMGVAEI